MKQENRIQHILKTPKPVTLRSVCADDDAFLLEVYASTRLDELAATPWDESQREAFLRLQFAAQQQHYQSHYPEADHQLILLDGRKIGRVYVARRTDEVRILDIALLPEHRNSGIGTSMINAIQSEASKMGTPVRIYVESFNPSLRLFERLGFASVQDIGTHLLMEWRGPA
ncbi:MAG: GNAT family N-acetyltransferase [Acidobacteriota bacterium]